MTVVTRFAPSPTGFLHIGGARTALFNWLFARHHGGVFRLRIEDTDRERSTEAATQAILTGLTWLGLDWDDEVVHQCSRAARHQAVALQLLESGHAYRCYASSEELAALRAEGKPYDRRWRDAPASDAPVGAASVIRFKAPLDPVTLSDHVRGSVTVPAGQLEDLVILRSDGTPTYNLAVVVDDHDMGVTHVIRGEDHLTNAAKQQAIYEALGWAVPEFAHIPLIHGADGAKLSKRHGALGIEAYREMGYLPEALRNYLLRLGWAHGDDEIISTEQAVAWFDLAQIGASPSRFELPKLDYINGHYLREADDDALVALVLLRLAATAHWPPAHEENAKRTRLLLGMKGLKMRAKTLVELAENAMFYIQDAPIALDGKARALLTDEIRELLRAVMPLYMSLQDWSEQNIETATKQYVETHGMKLGHLAQPLRAALCGSLTSPGIFEVMMVLGPQETLARLAAIC